jgi:hypothetical protein
MELHLQKDRQGGTNQEPNWEDLEGTLREFRDSVRTAAERPGPFWESQRAAVNARLQQPRPDPWRRRAWIIAPVAAAVVLCLFLFVENGKAPTPDFAGGSDQDLLIDVERALDQECPSALQPVALLTQEMGQNERTTGP